MSAGSVLISLASCEKKPIVTPDQKTYPNTITFEGNIPTHIDGEPGDSTAIAKLTAVNHKGDNIEVKWEVEGVNKDIVEISEFADGDSLKIVFKEDGEVDLTQSATSKHYTENNIKYTAQTNEKSTKVEIDTPPVELGFNAEKVAELQEQFDVKFIEGEEVTIMGSDLVNLPEGYDFRAVNPVIKITPERAIAYDWLFDNNNRAIGIKLKMDYDYRGDDINIQFEIDDKNGERIHEEFTVPRGVIMDVSNPEQVRADMIEHFKDLFLRAEDGPDLNGGISKWISKSPKVCFKGAPEEVKTKFIAFVDDLNATLSEVGSVVYDGTPFQVEIVDESEANVDLFFGSSEEFSTLYDKDIANNVLGTIKKIKADSPHGGTTKEIIGGLPL